MKKRIFNTDFLFPVQNEWTGIGSVLDVIDPNTPYNYSQTGTEADLKAIAHDWGVVGEDLKDTIESHKPKK